MEEQREWREKPKFKINSQGWCFIPPWVCPLKREGILFGGVSISAMQELCSRKRDAPCPPEDTCQQRINNTHALTHPDCCQVHGQETVTAHASSPMKPCCWNGPPSETLQTNSSSYSGFLHWRLSGTQPDLKLQSVLWNSDTSVKLCWCIDALKQMPYVWLLVRNCVI